MMKFFLIIVCVIPWMSFASGMNFSSDYKGPFEPPFEKIYVERNQLVTFPDGVYYRDNLGNLNKVRTVCADCDGLYVIRVIHQCPCCGRCNEGQFLDEMYGCPHYMRRVSSWLWVD